MSTRNSQVQVRIDGCPNNRAKEYTGTARNDSPGALSG